MQLGLSWGPDLPRAIAGASARLSAARILQDIHAAVQPLKLDDSAWVKDYKTFTSNLIQRADELTTRLRQEMVQCSKSVDELEIATSKAAGDCNKCSSDMARAVAELAVIQSTVQALRGKWESLVGQGVPWDDDEFARVKARQGKWLNLERMAETHLATARRIREYEEVSKLVEDRRANLRILRDRLQQVSSKVTLAKGVHELLEKRIENHTTEQIEALRSVVAPLFARMQANRVFDTVRTGDSALDWLGMAQGSSFSPDRHFSQGQRQDLALSIFLARARGLGGSFLLDEPLAHLDDLNRVALLDAMRVIVVEEDSDVNLVITTANRTLVKHLLQKFARVPVKRDTRPLRVYEMAGNPRVGVTVTELD